MINKKIILERRLSEPKPEPSLKLEKGTALPVATVQLKTMPTVNDCHNLR